MHAQVITIQIRPSKLQGALSIYRDFVLPVLQKQTGFYGGHLYTDSGSGKGLMVLLWQTAENMSAIEASGLLQEQLIRFQPVLGAPVTREHFLVNELV